MACFNNPLRSMVVAAATLALLVVSVSLVAHARNTADYTEAEQTNTLKFLQMFSSWSPLMASSWTGTDFCSWVYVNCADNGDLSLASGFGSEVLPDGYMFSLPEMSDDIVGEEVAITSFVAQHMFNHLVGTLPNTWGRLTRLNYFHVISQNVTGSIPASWGQMTSLQNIAITSSHLCGCIPEEWRLKSQPLSTPSSVKAENCSTANACPLETTTTTTEEPATSSSASSTSAATTTTEEPTTTTTTEKPTTSSSSFSTTSAATSSSSSSASSISATTTSTTAVCAVAHCLQCHKESASVCVLCATGYTPTVDLRCALPISGARFPTVASTGLWTALVVLVFLVAFVSPA